MQGFWGDRLFTNLSRKNSLSDSIHPIVGLLSIDLN
jgi:hypothetical protein